MNSLRCATKPETSTTDDWQVSQIQETGSSLQGNYLIEESYRIAKTKPRGESIIRFTEKLSVAKRRDRSSFHSKSCSSLLSRFRLAKRKRRMVGSRRHRFDGGFINSWLSARHSNPFSPSFLAKTELAFLRGPTKKWKTFWRRVAFKKNEEERARWSEKAEPAAFYINVHLVITSLKSPSNFVPRQYTIIQ